MKKAFPLLNPADDDCNPVPLEPSLSEADSERLAQTFAALGDPVRLRLYSLIAAQPEGVCACSLVEPVGRSQPTVSHHLKVLFEAGLVGRERRGSWIWYRAIPNDLLAHLAPAFGSLARR